MKDFNTYDKKKMISQEAETCSMSSGEECGFSTLKLSEPSKVLLHSCCGPCSTSVIERLSEEYKITVFYFNPCITDEEEYEKRKENQIAYINSFNKETPGYEVEFLEGNYNPDGYFKMVEGFEGEPEGGKRCELCIGQRLRETAKMAKSLNLNCFTTTLSVSPHKSYPLISKLGKELAEEYGIEFLDFDFKKKAGFQRSIQLAKEHGLYRQDYCGCQFSKRY